MTKNMWMVRAGEGAYLIDEFKRNFGFEVNLGLLKFSWGATEK